jgi:two-component system phosphate regulon sensor histidine kinase PhoR
MSRSKWFFHPIAIFIFSILALGLSLFLYIYWYMKVSTGLKAVVRRFNLDSGQVLASQTWVVILVLSILVGIILLGIFIIFGYNQKTQQLYRLQHNFINNFTHELKTPVTSMKLYLETFLKHELPRSDQVKYVHYMLQDAGRLLENINRILNLARIESRSYSGEFAVWDLVRVVDRFYKDNRDLFRDCEVHLQNPTGRSFPCRINRPLFEMLLMNLFTNAIKYNQNTPPRIQVAFETRKRRQVIRFQDNGIGIEKAHLDKIFRKFYQIGSADNMSAKGSGLGLYLVDCIARIHKGRICAESPGPGKGSTFTLTLPLNGLP